MTIGESTSVSNGARESARRRRATGASGITVMTRCHACGSSTLTSCTRGFWLSASVMNVAAPFNIAKPSSTQFDRTPISRQ